MKWTLMLLMLIPTMTYGQVNFRTEDDIEKLLKGFESQASLNSYLWNNGFLDKRFHKSRELDSTIFELDGFEIDFFRKNLFGTIQSELILQLRDGKNWTVAVFYEQDGVLLKVPGCLGPDLFWYRHLGRTYLNCMQELSFFIFDFIAIASPNQFNLISKTSEECGSGEYVEQVIWNISEDTICTTMSWITNGWSRYYAGEFYTYSIESNFQIIDSDSYPRRVRLTTKVTEEFWANYENDSTGTLTSRSTVTTYHFKSSGSLDYAIVNEEDESNTTLYRRLKEE